MTVVWFSCLLGKWCGKLWLCRMFDYLAVLGCWKRKRKVSCTLVWAAACALTHWSSFPGLPNSLPLSRVWLIINEHRFTLNCTKIHILLDQLVKCSMEMTAVSKQFGSTFSRLLSAPKELTTSLNQPTEGAELTNLASSFIHSTYDIWSGGAQKKIPSFILFEAPPSILKSMRISYIILCVFLPGWSRTFASLTSGANRHLFVGMLSASPPADDGTNKQQLGRKDNSCLFASHIYFLIKLGLISAVGAQLIDGSDLSDWVSSQVWETFMSRSICLQGLSWRLSAMLLLYRDIIIDMTSQQNQGHFALWLKWI